MNTKELNERVTYSFVRYGTFKVSIIFRDKVYFCESNNTAAVDRIRETKLYDMDERKVSCGYYTFKSALLALYNECKVKNNL